MPPPLRPSVSMSDSVLPMEEENKRLKEECARLKAENAAQKQEIIALKASLAKNSNETNGGEKGALAALENATEVQQHDAAVVPSNEIMQDAERRALIVDKTRNRLKNECLTPMMVLFDIFQPSVRAEEGGKGWGKITVTVRTGFEETAAFFWDVERFDEEGVERFVERRGSDFEMDVRKTLLNSNISSQVRNKINRQSTSGNSRSETSKDSKISKLGDMMVDR